MTRWSIRSAIGSLTLVALVSSANVAVAGPPLLCHPFDIGTAQSLPWDGASGWQGRASAGNPATLVADTEALLTPATPIIVRMETIRRAALYASLDTTVASQLLARLQARAANDRTEAGSLARFDAGYLIETYRQLGAFGSWRREDGVTVNAGALKALIANTDGNALVQQALAERGGDAAMEFAAALIAGSYGGRQADYEKHAKKARAGAARDALLTRNLNHISGT